MTRPRPRRDEVHVWTAPLDIAPPTLTALVAGLSDDELSRARRFAGPVLEHRFAARRGWLRYLLGGYLDAAPAQLRFAAGEHGKPHVVHPDSAWLRFSVSSSGDVAVIAVSSEREVGVDVELVHDGIDIDRVARRALTADDRGALAELAGAERVAAFYARWTRREAYLKALGLGLGHEPAPPQPHPGLWTVCTVEVGPAVAGALAVEGCAVTVTTRQLTLGTAGS